MKTASRCHLLAVTITLLLMPSCTQVLLEPAVPAVATTSAASGGAASGRRGAAALKSPEVLADHRVTFRVRAPLANRITINGDWMPPNTQTPLNKDAQGVWSVTLGPLASGIAIYNFTMDGLAIADPTNPKMKLRASTSASLLEVPGDGKELWEIQNVPHGRVEINYIASKVLGDQTREVRVYTPPGYDADTAARFPVMYLFHGTNDTAAGWTDVGRANDILDNLIAQKKALPMIIVMPWGHATPYGARGGGAAPAATRSIATRPGATNPADPNETANEDANTALFQRYLLEDLMPVIDKTYRVTPGRENRAIVGLSMGGGQALAIGLTHLDVFSAVAAFSAPVPNDFEQRYQSLLNDPTGTNGRINVFFVACGKADPAFPKSESLDRILTAHHINHTFQPSEGYHNYTNWRLYLGETAPLLFRENEK